jgi:hypothetical protein
LLRRVRCWRMQHDHQHHDVDHVDDHARPVPSVRSRFGRLVRGTVLPALRVQPGSGQRRVRVRSRSVPGGGGHRLVWRHVLEPVGELHRRAHCGMHLRHPVRAERVRRLVHVPAGVRLRRDHVDVRMRAVSGSALVPASARRSGQRLTRSRSPSSPTTAASTARGG